MLERLRLAFQLYPWFARQTGIGRNVALKYLSNRHLGQAPLSGHDNAVSDQGINVENDRCRGFNSGPPVSPAASISTHLSNPIIRNLMEII